VLQTPSEKAEAIRSLLPLIEAHLDRHPSSRLTPRYLDLDPLPAGPPHQAPSDEPWLVEYSRLRRAYPIIDRLQKLLTELMYEHANWASALYWHYMQPWDNFNRDKRQDWAEAAVAWLAKRCPGYIPTYHPQGLRLIDHRALRDDEILALREEGLSYHAIAECVGCSKSTIRDVLRDRVVRPERHLVRPPLTRDGTGVILKP
jgi:hypothetical protein